MEQDDGSGSATTASDDDDEEEIEIEDELMALEELLMNGASFTYKAPKSLTKRQSVDSSHFDFDAFDDSLQKQWQKDRAKKALKRQERYLKRLEAQPTKSNRKKAKRAGASQDIWSDFADTFANATVQPDFHRIDSNIRSFVEDTSRAEIALPPMDKKFRYAVHMLADAYRYVSPFKGPAPG